MMTEEERAALDGVRRSYHALSEYNRRCARTDRIIYIAALVAVMGAGAWMGTARGAFALGLIFAVGSLVGFTQAMGRVRRMDFARLKDAYQEIELQAIVVEDGDDG